MSGTFKLRIVSPLDVLLDQTVVAAQLPTVNGQIGVLPGHCSYTGLLGKGVIKYQTASAAPSESVEIAGGFCRYGDNTLTVLAD